MLTAGLQQGLAQSLGQAAFLDVVEQLVQSMRPKAAAARDFTMNFIVFSNVVFRGLSYTGLGHGNPTNINN